MAQPDRYGDPVIDILRRLDVGPAPAPPTRPPGIFVRHEERPMGAPLPAWQQGASEYGYPPVMPPQYYAPPNGLAPYPQVVAAEARPGQLLMPRTPSRSTVARRTGSVANPNVRTGTPSRWRVAAYIGIPVVVASLFAMNTDSGASACNALPVCGSLLGTDARALPGSVDSSASFNATSGGKLTDVATYTIKPGFAPLTGGTKALGVEASVELNKDVIPKIAVEIPQVIDGKQTVVDTAKNPLKYAPGTTVRQYLDFLEATGQHDACLADLRKVVDTSLGHSTAMMAASSPSAAITSGVDTAFNAYKYAPYTNKKPPKGTPVLAFYGRVPTDAKHPKDEALATQPTTTSKAGSIVLQPLVSVCGVTG